jgi:SAM-dependent methyltransferase
VGAGGGHLLSHLTPAFDASAVDLSPEMIALSQALNPTVKHHLGDMRTARLGEFFDAVVVHDAIDYMLSEDDLRAALATASENLRPGGVALLMPDYVRETFAPHAAETGSRRAGALDAVYVSYAHDPDPSDTAFELVMLFLLRERGLLRVVEDRHACGLFPLGTWLRLVEDAGFTAELHDREGNTPGTPAIAGVKR